MKKIILDTNAYSAFKQGQEEIIKILQHADIIGMSVIVLGELVAGFSAGTKSKKNLNELNEFLNTPRVTLFPIDDSTVSFYAQVYSILRRKGKPIPSNDLWIAATTLQHGFKLCSFDKHFDEVDNLLIATTLTDLLL